MLQVNLLCNKKPILASYAGETARLSDAPFKMEEELPRRRYAGA
ncbi:hypothetical protein BN126_1196 [Cronobacter sakazakii 680]|nr:hypothetical protein BN126_1196 [Cronobacter sakazakii 680]